MQKECVAAVCLKQPIIKVEMFTNMFWMCCRQQANDQALEQQQRLYVSGELGWSLDVTSCFGNFSHSKAVRE